jgi:hypothetical protein
MTTDSKSRGPALATFCLAAFLAAGGVTTPAMTRSAQKPGSASLPLDVENAQIVRLEHLWLHALDRGNIAEINRILAAGFRRPAPSAGRFITKAQLLAYYRKHWPVRPAGTRTRFAQLDVQFYGDVAIARGILTTRNSQGNLLRKSLFTDVFVRRQGHWQAVSAQENMVPNH